MMLIHDEEFEDYEASCVAIDPDDLNGEYIRLSSDVAYWSRRSAQIEEEYLRSKAELKEAESRAYLHVRETLSSNAKKAPTGPHIEAMAQVHPSVVAANREFADLSGQRKRIHGILDAISAKKDMLVQLGADRRQELKTIGV